MSREFSEIDKKIFNKLVPEINSCFISEAGHQYPFILRPVSHKFSIDSDDFKNRILKLNKEEINYLSNLILSNKEELRTLNEEDIYIFLDIVEEKISSDKKKELKNHIGIL